jgi:hypothetical protein
MYGLVQIINGNKDCYNNVQNMFEENQQLQYRQHQYGSEQQYQQRININEKIYHLIKEIGNVYG